MTQITLEDFKRVELKIGKIVKAEVVLGSDKLLKLQIDLGEEDLRQIVSGIGGVYLAQDIVNKLVVVVSNLAPKQFLGVESQGMLLCADLDKPVLLSPIEDVLPGSKVR